MLSVDNRLPVGYVATRKSHREVLEHQRSKFAPVILVGAECGEAMMQNRMAKFLQALCLGLE